MRRYVLWCAWLLLGGAIAVAIALIAAGAGTMLHVVVPVVPAAVLGSAVGLLAALLGLVPGVRELEVTAAHSMLGVPGTLIEDSTTATHRRRTVGAVAWHLIAGMGAGTALVVAVPTAYLEWGGPLAAAATLLATLAMLWALGWLSTRALGRLLGPTAADRVVVLERRLRAEASYTRIARELHDGIGHALAAIGLQAAAARRVLGHDPDSTAAALAAIEDVTRSAQGELDDVLGVLRRAAADEDASHADDLLPSMDLTDLPTIVARHESAGLRVGTDVDGDFREVPRPVSATAARVVAEGLTNALRHGAGSADLSVRQAGDVLTIGVRNPLGRHPAPSTGGRGLLGIAERVELLGGRFTAAAGVDGVWILAVEFPLPEDLAAAP